jgi:hypothetical protein
MAQEQLKEFPCTCGGFGPHTGPGHAYQFLGDRHIFPHGAVAYQLMLRGSGSPEDDHDILGITFLGQDGNVLFVIGEGAK